MKEWLQISLLLCVFGFLKEMRPSELFIYEYLIGPWWNMTDEQVLQKVYPVVTYSYLAQLVVVFLITDLCRYKPLIIVLGLSGVLVGSLLIWGSTLLELQIMEVAYGTLQATEVAYYTYIYAKVPKEYYAQVTAHARAAFLAGRCFSGGLAQILVSFEILDYKGLNYISFSALIAATIWSLLLPSAPKSVYFHSEEQTPKGKYRNAFNLMKRHFVESYSSMYVLKWSVWWALATGGYNQVQFYYQPLWSEINDDSSFHNGTVEAVLTLVGCLGALSANYLKIDWKRRGELVLSVYSILAGSLLIIGSQTDHLIVSYTCCIVFGGLYHSTITIATSEVAKCILENSYGLVFGFNTFIALIIQTFATLCLVSGDLGWALPPTNQHLSYGIYHMSLAVIFILIGVVDFFISSKVPNKT